MVSVVFMGTPDFSVPALKALHDIFTVTCVFSRPPVASGRGKKIRHSPVHQCALSLGLACETPKTLKDPLIQFRLKELNPDFIIVAAYGLMLPRAVLDIAPCLNIHASLLPRWRGAAPIQRAIIAGDTQSGITVMHMEEGLDTGPMLSSRAVMIKKTDNAGDLHDALARTGAALITEALQKFSTLHPETQDDALATYAAKISKQEAFIDWSQSAEHVARLIRAMAPYPGCRFTLDGTRIKLLSASTRPFFETEKDALPGTVLNDRLHIACAGGVIVPEILQREGKGMLPAEDFLRGFTSTPGSRAE